MSGKRGVRKKEGENLTYDNIEKVIKLLEAEKPITKKEAYAILNIASNPVRLGKIIDEHKEEKATAEKRRAANRGKPASTHEIQIVIEGVLDGDSIAELSERLYRPPSFVKKVVEDIGIPEKAESYWEPTLIPEGCISENFEVGQIVWSARYGAMAIVRDYYPAHSQYNKQEYDCYQIYVIEAIETPSPYFPRIQDYGGKYAVSAYYDLGSLEHLKAFGIDIYRPYRSTFEKWLIGR